jgi:hypothetical protein
MNGDGEDEKNWFEKYRWFYTSSGKLVVGGKNSKQNEDIMRRVDSEDIIMHTSTPGSPFCIIKKPDKKDMEETAIFTACFSHEWKKMKKRSEIHIFKGEQVIKKNNMREGTFAIQGSVFKKKVDLKLVLDFQQNKLRAVPVSAAKQKLVTLTPGSLGKDAAIKKILKIIKGKYGYPITKDEIASAIPSDNIEVR